MTEDNFNDPITDQEKAFAHLVLSGTMTDQQAAAAVGLDPNTAPYIKSKPRVLAYILEQQARTQQQLAEQQNESQRGFHIGRERVLDRLWELAALSSEATRGSITGQVKAISMIVAIEGMIPDRRAAEKNPAAPLPTAQIYEAEWLRKQKAQAAALQPNPAQQEDGLGNSQAELAPGPAADLSPDSSPAHDPVSYPSDSTFAPETLSSDPAAFAPDTRVPFSIQKNRFGRHR